MPTYSYMCMQCDNRFDMVQAFSDDALTTCRHCSGRLRKLFSPVGVVFKGSGFYQNDSRKGAKASKTGSNGSDKPGSSASSESKSGSSGKSGPEKSTTSGDKSTSSTGSTASASTSG